ncbi:protein ALTERED XYLOGLUCAN 4 [Iris pallida]|uniref:Protein ALTERED XYLOGLUCAN 4 n=1 Tax=Iris pallida TaxID=29817 RepID=A0AAX6DT84_IRIPA|nr:protein ALTERED XYLOGLUCAN 4 [Iris pallida]
MKLASTAPKKKQQMGTSPHRPSSIFFTKKFLFRATFLLLFLAFLRHYVFPTPTSTIQQQQQEEEEVANPSIQSKKTSTLPPTTSSQGIPRDDAERPCDYADGRWVRSERGPLYNGTSCGTIKEGQNCMAHGRPDAGYLRWRWQPDGCALRPFDPLAFLGLIRGRHLAFVGDSLARNQLESLLCLLSSASPPELVYRDGDDNKFRRWVFSSHNATVSVFWSPFLVRGIEKSPETGRVHNQLFLDHVDERWASELDNIDAVVLSVGHWFLLPAFFNEDGRVVGCHICPPGANHTEAGFFDAFRKAVRTTLRDVARRRGSHKHVVLTTFSPAHFDGEWDKAGACPKEEPFGEGEKEMEYVDAEMRKIEVEEVAAVAAEGAGGRQPVSFEALDVTKLAMMRPDGHPGPYMYPNPFADGPKDRVPNDCVHWCMPGPVDTWNEILLEMMSRWRETESGR